jgi:hypothetical protein
MGIINIELVRGNVNRLKNRNFHGIGLPPEKTGQRSRRLPQAAGLALYPLASDGFIDNINKKIFWEVGYENTAWTRFQWGQKVD